jgi:hypothetical protein
MGAKPKAPQAGFGPRPVLLRHSDRLYVAPVNDVGAREVRLLQRGSDDAGGGTRTSDTRIMITASEVDRVLLFDKIEFMFPEMAAHLEDQDCGLEVVITDS